MVNGRFWSRIRYMTDVGRKAGIRFFVQYAYGGGAGSECDL